MRTHESHHEYCRQSSRQTGVEPAEHQCEIRADDDEQNEHDPDAPGRRNEEVFLEDARHGVRECQDRRHRW